MDEWTLLPALVVRTTGFPFELIERLRFTRTTTRIREVLAHEDEIARLQRRLLAEIIPALVRQTHDAGDRESLALLSRWRRAINRRRGCAGLARPAIADAPAQAELERWNELLERYPALLDAAQAVWRDELDEQRRVLRGIVEDARVQEAIFLSSPDMYAALQRYLRQDPSEPRVSAVRKFERRLVFYLQRLCAKNETQSFFGPINYGRIEPGTPANLLIQRSPTPLRRRVAFPSQWMVEALAARLGEEEALRPFLRPRRTPLCSVRDGAIGIAPLGRALRIDATAERIVKLADGRLTVAELADRLGLDWAVVWERMEQLRRAQVLTTAIVVPADLSDPLAYLRQWVAWLPGTLELRGHWSAALDALHTLLQAFAEADLPARVELLAAIEGRFTELCGDLGRRGGGAMYADRLLLFEECLGDLEQCVLGGGLAETISARLQPILRLAYTYGRLQAQRDQHIADGIWGRTWPERSSVPLAAYLQAVSQWREPAGAGGPDALDAWMVELRELVRSQAQDGCAALRGADLPALCAPPDDDECRYTSLDLLIAAPDEAAVQRGAFELVLGEIHPQPLTWVFPTAYFAEQAGADLGALVREGLGRQPGGAVAAQIVGARKNKIYPYPLPGAQIELRPRYPDCRAVGLADIDVHRRDGELELRAGARRLRLYTPLHRRAQGVDPLAPFMFPAVQPPPIDLGAHTPRILIEGVVYQRERWVVPGAAFDAGPAQGFALFLETWRRKQQHGLPDEVFARAPQEPKPVYVDFASYFLVELFAYVARQSERLTLTEMLPNGRQLWLGGPGGRYSCEFRAMAIGR